MFPALTKKLEKIPAEAWLIAAGIVIYLASFFVARFLGFIYAVPLILVLPLIAWYLLQSIVKPVLILVPMLGAIYLGSIIKVIPDGVVPLTLFQILLFLGLAIYLFHYLLHEKHRFRIMGFELELLLIFTLISFSIIYSPNRESALINFSRILFLVLFAYLIINVIQKQKHFYATFVLLTVITVILGLLSFHSALLNPVIAAMNLQAGGTRIFGRGAITIEDPNVFASLFFLPISFIVSAFFSQISLRWRFVALITGLLLAAGLASTFSRSAWIATAFLLLVLVVYYRQYKLMGFLVALVVVVVMSIPELRNMAFTVINRIFDIFAGSEDDSSRIRVLLGIAAIRMFFDSWFMGVGFRGFPERFTDYFTTQESIDVVEPHNITYEILAELGIVGFGLILFLVYRIFRMASENIRKSGTEPEKIIATSLIASLTGYIVFFQFYGGALVSTNLWAIIGLIVAYSYYLHYHGKESRQNLPAFGSGTAGTGPPLK
ncbi:O-antigen ligase family protein [Balneolales bacterium ANBcel1]|nr:O-antigen ligase family protein [Balneolales bacterium ANBcel1]